VNTGAHTDLPEFLGGDPIPSAPHRRSRLRDSADGHTPGEPGLWVFVLGDMSLFGAFFIALLWQRRTTTDVFATSARELTVFVGVLNTAVLLFSSYLVVCAIWGHRHGLRRQARRNLAGALTCAAVFAVLKVFEYSHALNDGNGPTTNAFYTFYFILTGIHLLHVLIGAGLLGAWLALLRRGTSSSTPRLVEGIAVYWHMVDLLWVVIFTLLYVACAA